ncbi:MAG: peptide chain release factor N(5)-glutamine methyltransferase [Clostridia bacterium]|nr:peptide chain release factor N(5)-glutamine methyltransferase [Clostridia bacterium]
MIITLEKCFFETVAFLEEHGIEDAKFDAREIILHATKIDRVLFGIQSELKISDEKQERVKELLLKRVQGIPLQYILGEWDFYGYTFDVTEGVLIPRPETEELTDLAIAEIAHQKKVIYDICGGTGCIGLAIAIECPQTEVYIFEKYPIPCACIRNNIIRYGLNNVHLEQCDVLDFDEWDDFPRPDLIVSNPPYIPTGELDDLQEEVKKEPMTALDGGEDGMLFYRALSKNWFAHLREGGMMFLECSEEQPQLVMDLFDPSEVVAEQSGTRKDFYGLDRFVYIKKAKKGKSR